MELLGLALIPMVLCGAMCAGAALLAAVGLRGRRRCRSDGTVDVARERRTDTDAAMP